MISGARLGQVHAPARALPALISPLQWMRCVEQCGYHVGRMHDPPGLIIRDRAEVPGGGRGARTRPWIAALVAAALGLCAGALLMWTTAHGSGLVGDSHAYVASAQNVVHGHWVSFADYTLADDPKPLEQFPPGYPLMLAAGSVIGVDALDFARWLNLGALLLTFGLVGLLTWWRTESLGVLALILLLLTISPTLLHAFARVMSEGVFLANCLVFLVALVAAHRTLQRPGWRTALLVFAGLTAGWACTIRYAGILLVCVGVAALLLWPNPSRGGPQGYRYTPARRGMAATLFLLTAALLPVPLAVFNLWVLGRPTSRPLRFHPPTQAQAVELFETVGRWLVPAHREVLPIPIVLSLGAVAFCLLTFAPPAWLLVKWLRRRAAGANAGEALRCVWPGGWDLTLYLFAAGYLPFILAAFTFQDAGIPLNWRILLPMLVIGSIFAVGAAGSRVWPPPREAGDAPEAAQRPDRPGSRPGGNSLRLALTGLLLVVLGANAVSQAEQAWVRGHVGWGFARPRWDEDALVRLIREDAPSVADRPLIGNGGDLVGLLTNRRMAHVPKWFSRPRRAHYGQMPHRIRQMGRWAMANDARLIYFTDLADRDSYLSDLERLSRYLHLDVVQSTRSGRVYRVVAIKGFEDEDYDGDGRPDLEKLPESQRP